MATDLEDLTAEVAEAKTIMQSAVTLIRGLAAALAAAGTDPVKLRELRAGLDTEGNALAAAVSENTQVAEPPAEPIP